MTPDIPDPELGAPDIEPADDDGLLDDEGRPLTRDADELG